MNTLSEKAVKDFKELYLLQYGVELSYDVAEEKALKLLRLFKHIYKPIPTKKYEKS
jgi:hypothetical protein